MVRNPIAWPVVLALGILAAGGCREELGPESMETTQVSGTIHIRNQPVGGGWIEFYPADGTIGNLRSAPVRPDGSFMADGVAVGTNAIKLVHPRPPIEARLPGGGVFEGVALFRRDIGKGPASQIDIDLLDEYVRYVRAQKPG